MNKALASVVFVLAFSGLILSVLAGCRAPVCRKMSQCCEVIKDHPAVGHACGKLAEGVDDPDTCRTVLSTVDTLFKRRSDQLPDACQ